MIINPLNVVRLLLVSISSIYLTETAVTDKEIELKENIQKLLLDSIFHYNGLEVTDEIYLDFEEPYKLHSFEIIEDDEEAWHEDNLNSHSQCSNDDPRVYSDEPDKLVNGISTTIEEYPHSISIRVNNNHFCGGTIIDRFYVLTAGHCVAPLLQNTRLRQSLFIVSGTTYLSTGGQIHWVEKLWVHERYNYYDPSGRGSFDIGLIKLAAPIQFNSRQQPIKLPTRNIAPYDIVTIAAWGSTGFKRPVHNNLQKLNARVMLPDTCQSYYKNFMKIDKTEFCTLITYGIGLCNGDSGSGLIRNGEIVGLVSGGRPCAKGYPDVYTNVYSYLSWIIYKMTL